MQEEDWSEEPCMVRREPRESAFAAMAWADVPVLANLNSWPTSTLPRHVTTAPSLALMIAALPLPSWAGGRIRRLSRPFTASTALRDDPQTSRACFQTFFTLFDTVRALWIPRVRPRWRPCPLPYRSLQIELAGDKLH